jgi:hypothetical protein
MRDHSMIGGDSEGECSPTQVQRFTRRLPRPPGGTQRNALSERTYLRKRRFSEDHATRTLDPDAVPQ